MKLSEKEITRPLEIAQSHTTYCHKFTRIQDEFQTLNKINRKSCHVMELVGGHRIKARFSYYKSIY